MLSKIHFFVIENSSRLRILLALLVKYKKHEEDIETQKCEGYEENATKY